MPTPTQFARSPSSKRMTRSSNILLLCGVVAGPLYVVAGVFQVPRVGFDPTRHRISLMSNGDLGWIQIANFLVTGLLVIACSVGMRRSASRRGRNVGAVAGGPLWVGAHWRRHLCRRPCSRLPARDAGRPTCRDNPTRHAALCLGRGGISRVNRGLFHVWPPLRRSAAAWMGSVLHCDGPHILRSFLWHRLWIQEIVAHHGLHGRCRSGLVMAIAGVGTDDDRAAQQRREGATLRFSASCSAASLPPELSYSGKRRFVLTILQARTQNAGPTPLAKAIMMLREG